METDLGRAHGVLCPKCQTLIIPTDAAVSSCRSCGHRAASTYLREITTLTPWHDWAGQRLMWLADRVAHSDMPTTAPIDTSRSTELADWDAGPDSADTRPAETRDASAGGFLLVLGSILLVLAGIAFVAFAWDALGPIGQIVTLFVIGAACAQSAIPLAGRLPGTAAAVGVVGTLVFATATVALRVEGDAALSVAMSLLCSLVAATALALWGVHASRAGDDLGGVGQFAGGVGAFLTLTLVATSTVDDAVVVTEPSWFIATAVTVTSLVFLVVAPRCRMLLWPPLAALFLGVGTASAAVYANTIVNPQTAGVTQLVTAVVCLCAALLVVLLAYALPPHRVVLAVLAVGLVAGGAALAFVTALDTPAVRVAAAVYLLVVAGCLAVLADVTGRRGAFEVTAALVSAASVGLLLSPWQAVPDVAGETVSVDWATSTWPIWRGALAGFAFVAVLMATQQLTSRFEKDGYHNEARSTFPLVAVLAAAGTWTLTTFQHVASRQIASFPGASADAVEQAILSSFGLASAIFGITLLALAVARRAEPWWVWLGAGSLMATVVLVVQPDEIAATHWRPEIYAVLLALPVAIAGFEFWWLKRPEQTSTWITLAPAVSLVLAPSLLSVVTDSLLRWGTAETPSTTYQVRLVSLVAVGVLLCGFGARQHLAGLFYPGSVALLAIAGIALVDVGRFLPQWVSFAIAGTALLIAGARWEAVRRIGTERAHWAQAMR